VSAQAPAARAEPSPDGPTEPPARALPLRLEPVSVADAGFHRAPAFAVRVGALGVVALAVFALLLLRLWSLQVLDTRRSAAALVRQSSRIVSVPATRGAIVDREGRLLAGTEGRLVVTANPAALGGEGATRWHPSRRGRVLLERLARLAGTREQVLERRIQASFVRSPYAAAVVLPRPSRSLAFYLEERRHDFPGVGVRSLYERRYPQGALGSEFLGLLGEISPAQLRAPGYRSYRAGDVIGQSGVEAAYNGILGTPSRRARLLVDALGRPRGRPRLIGPPRPVRNLRLTIDTRLQRVAEQAIRDGIGLAHAAGHPDADAGAAVVMNPSTGAIYALASYPSFDQVAAADDPSYLLRLLRGDDPSRPLLDRATQGLYPVGSTFKPVVAEAALADGLITPTTLVPCTGSLQVGNVLFHNVEAGVNALLTLPQALSISCDTWFYRLGTWFYARQARDGALDMQRWAWRLGFGHRTGVDLPGEASGLVPTPAWLRRTFSSPWERIWYEGYSVNLSIGQGFLEATPLQLAVAYSALANGGTIVRPHLADAVLDASGRVVRRLSFPARRRVRLVDLHAIREGLYSAAHDPGGTSAAVFSTFPVPVAGKTGTAQAPFGSDHSWYASWAPADHPEVVVVVLIEHGGFGAEAAAPAAREIYRAFFHLPR
jgi:penicillin-binding protein 2